MQVTAIETLKSMLAETLSEANAAQPSGDKLKDHWWQICGAMKAAITEIRQTENSGQPIRQTPYERS